MIYNVIEISMIIGNREVLPQRKRCGNVDVERRNEYLYIEKNISNRD